MKARKSRRKERKSHSSDTGTQAENKAGEQAFKDALPTLLQHPVFQRQRVICSLIRVSRGVRSIVVAYSVGAVDVSYPETVPGWLLSYPGWQDPWASSRSCAQRGLPQWVRKYASLVRSLHIASPWSDQLLAQSATVLAGLTRLSLPAVDYGLLDQLPRSLISLSVGPPELKLRPLRYTVRDYCNDYDEYPGYQFDDEPSDFGYDSSGSDTDSEVAQAAIPLVLTQLIALTHLHSKQLREHDELPVSLQDVSVDNCYNTKPLLELAALTQLSLGSAVRRYFTEADEDEWKRESIEYDFEDVPYISKACGCEWSPGLRCAPEPMEGLIELTALTGLSELKLKYNRAETVKNDASVWQTLTAFKSLHCTHVGTPWDDGVHWDERLISSRAYPALAAAVASSRCTGLTSLKLEVELGDGVKAQDLGSTLKQLTNLRELVVTDLWGVDDWESGALQHLFTELTGLDQLRRLECNMAIRDEAARAIAELTMLTSLDLTLPERNVPGWEQVFTGDHGGCGPIGMDNSWGPTYMECLGLDDAGLGAIAKGLQGLNELILDGNRAITDKGVRKVSEYLPRLTCEEGLTADLMRSLRFVVAVDVL